MRKSGVKHEERRLSAMGYPYMLSLKVTLRN